MNRRGRHARLPLLIGLLLLLALIPFALYRGSQVPDAEAAWWNPSWQYRKRIDVSNSNATDLTDFQVSFTLDTASLISAGKLQGQCQDIRLTDIGGRELPYWIEENNPGCNNANTKIWTKMSNLPASGATLYVYYSNAGAAVSSDHDGEQVFEFFEDMEDWDGWTTYSNGQVSQDDVRVFSGDYSAHKTTEGDPHGAYKDIGQTLGRNVVLEFMVNRNSGYTGGDVDRVGLIDNSGNGYGWFYSNAGNTIGKDKRTSYTASYTTSSADSGYMDTWVKAQLIISSDNTITARRFSGDLLIGEHSSADSSYSSFTRLYIFGGYDYWVDQVTIRKYASAEPTTSTQVEETGPGPVAYWKFDEGSGSTANDSAGNNIGTISGATWASEDQCVSGKCLNFDGTDDYVDMGNASRLEGFDNVTLSFWYKTATLPSSITTVIGKEGVYKISLNPSGQIRFLTGNNWAGSVLTTLTTLSTGRWYHITATYDGTTKRVYINGIPDTSTVSSSGSLGSSSNSFVIGATSSPGFTGFTPGQIDEPKIFPYALTEDQIKAEYNLGAAAVMGTGPTVAPPAGGTLSDSLVAHWAFDEKYGQTAHDKVGNNHGTFGASTSPGSDDPIWTAAGECKVNGCLSFDGMDDYVQIADGSQVDLDSATSEIFLSAWIKTSAGNAAIIGMRHSANGNPVIDLVLGYNGVNNQNSGIPSFLVRDNNGTGLEYITGSVPVNDGQWHHIAARRDSSKMMKIFVDGVEVASGSDTMANPVTVDTVRIGDESRNSAITNFLGQIDEVKIYNTALTADQIKQDMNAGASVAYSVGSEEADGAGAPPIAEWKFDEKQGTVAYDSSGNANDGTVNGATWKSGCQQGACLEFDGVDDYVTMGDIEQFTFQEDFTVEFWMYPRTGGSNFFWGGVSKAGTNGSREWELGFDPSQSDAIRFLIGNSTGSWDTDVIRGNGLSRNIWHHVVGRVSNGQIDIFIDGQQTGTSATYTNSLKNTTSPVYIGNVSSYETSSSFNGQIDHVKIYDYARTPAQIAYDYNRGAPVAHWKFDECEGTVAHDASGNENHGTINIGATGTQTTAGTCSTSGAWANGASGKFEGSLKFDGTDDYASIPNSSSLQVGGTFSIAAWIKPTSLSSRYGIFSTRLNNPSGSWQLEVGTASGGSNRVGVSGFNTWIKETTNDALTPNVWNHVVYTRSSNSDTGNIYVNGNLAPIFRSTTYTITDNADAKVIGQGTSSGQFFPGQIDDIRLYNYALSPAQVQKVFNQGYGVRYGSN